MDKANHVLRIRLPDGSWVFDMDNPMPKRQAEYQAKQNRIFMGILCQVWTEKEAASVLASSEIQASGGTQHE
jgi:hypothetical protein